MIHGHCDERRGGREKGINRRENEARGQARGGGEWREENKQRRVGGNFGSVGKGWNTENRSWLIFFASPRGHMS